MEDTEILSKILDARRKLLLDYPWFGTLSLLLKVELDPTLKYAAGTDGTRIVFEPQRAADATMQSLVVLWAHEVAHCALQHPFRRGHRDHNEWNVACDFAINPLLKDAGLEIPDNWLYDPQYENMGAEAIYAKRSQDRQQDQQGQNGQQQQQASGAGQQQQPGGQPQQQPGQTSIPDSAGRFEDAPPQNGQQGQGPGQGNGQGQTGQVDPNATPAPQMTAEDWKIAGEQAMRVCSKAGNDPGAAARAAKAAHEPDTDWRGELQDFVEHQVPSDYSWGSPNRRHIANGLYLPGVYKENLGTIVFGVDCSGSISKRLLDIAASHAKSILQEAKAEKVLVVYWDTKVHGTQEFTPDDFEVEFRAHGGGGTRPQCLFDHLATLDEAPRCVVNFTDLDFYQQPAEPEAYPVLWLTGVQVRKTAPWGKTVRIDQWAA